MYSKIGKYIPFVFILTLLFTIGNILLTLNNIQTIRQNNNVVERTKEVSIELDNYYASILSAETSHRGYLLTGNSFYKENFATALASLDNSENRLKELVNDDKEQQERFVLLSQKVHNRLDVHRETQAIRDAQGFEAAREHFEEVFPNPPNREIRIALDQMREEETNQLANREAQTTQNYTIVYVTVIVAGIFNVLLLLFSYYLISKELSVRTELEKNKNEFINMASHELKTPITSLKVYSHVLFKKIDEKDYSESKRYLARIDDQTNKLTTLITDLLDLSRIQTGKMRFEKEPFNLTALIDETVDAIQGTTRKHKLVTKGDLDQLVYGDRYRIYQVLVNLLTNAIKYSPKGGKITVTTEKVGDKAMIGVSDEGIGIGEEFQQKIFDRLYQVTDPEEKTYPGLGIGLFVTKHIVEEHGGKIWVESEKGKGSTFFFTVSVNKS